MLQEKYPPPASWLLATMTCVCVWPVCWHQCWKRKRCGKKGNSNRKSETTEVKWKQCSQSKHLFNRNRSLECVQFMFYTVKGPGHVWNFSLPEQQEVLYVWSTLLHLAHIRCLENAKQWNRWLIGFHPFNSYNKKKFGQVVRIGCSVRSPGWCSRLSLWSAVWSWVTHSCSLCLSPLCTK